MTNKEAIKLLQSIEEDGFNVTAEHLDALDLAIKALEEQSQGEWILIDDVNDPSNRLNRYKCSECGRIIRIYDYQTLSDYPFCHCGADMQKGGAKC